MDIRVIIALLTLAALCGAAPAVETDKSSDDISGYAVNVTLYYESMCPFCRKFIVQQLYPTFVKLSSDVINVDIIPAGFEHYRTVNGTAQFRCQHGHNECVGNIIAVCALNMTDYDPDSYMPFINCMESHTTHGEEAKALKQCANDLITEDAVNNCMKSPEGAELQHLSVLRTKAAHMHYTPWIVVNGQHSDTIHARAYRGLLRYVCEIYTGPALDACKGITGTGVVG